MKPRLVGAAVAMALAIAGGMLTQLEGTRYVAYPDPATKGAPWTICQGHTRGAKQGDRATPEQCAAYLRADLLVANDAIDRCITQPLTVNERAALMSATINLGAAVVCGSTLQRKANAGDKAGMCRELTDALNARGEPMGWSYAGGVFYPGLRHRRFIERAQCEKP